MAGPETISLREIGEMFAADLGVEASFEHTHGTPADLVASTARMAEVLVAPSLTIAGTLADIRTP